ELVGYAAPGVRKSLAARLIARGLSRLDRCRAWDGGPRRDSGRRCGGGLGRRLRRRCRRRNDTGLRFVPGGGAVLGLGLGAHRLTPLGTVAVDRQRLETQPPAFEVGVA